MNVEEILKELSDKISKVYNLELVKELTNIYVNLADQIRKDDHKYFELVKKSAELEVKRVSIRSISVHGKRISMQRKGLSSQRKCIKRNY